MSDPVQQLPQEGEVNDENLLVAVKQLTRAVRSLDSTLKADYPDRTEVKRDRKVFIYAVLVALAASFFANVSTVNYCFLQGLPDEGERSFCQVFPGWDDSFDNNRRATETFLNMQKQIAENQREITELQSK